MKLSQFAKKAGVTYRKAFRWWQQGLPDALRHDCRHRRGNGRAPTAGTGGHLCPVSSRTQAEDLERQVQRFLHYCAAKSYQVARSVKEIASGLNDNRPQLLGLLKDPSIGTIVVEHKDGATRFGFRYLETLMTAQGRYIEVVNLAESNQEDVLADLTSVIYSLCARLYGQRQAKLKAETIVKQVEESCDSSSNTSSAKAIPVTPRLTPPRLPPKTCGTLPIIWYVSPSLFRRST